MVDLSRVVEELVDIVDDDDNVVATVTGPRCGASGCGIGPSSSPSMSTDGRLLDPSPQRR